MSYEHCFVVQVHNSTKLDSHIDFSAVIVLNRIENVIEGAQMFHSVNLSLIKHLAESDSKPWVIYDLAKMKPIGGKLSQPLIYHAFL